MAAQGNLYLSNAAVIELYERIKAYEGTVQDAFYSQYKNAFKLSVSNYFRGDAADAFKSYLTNGAINIINGFLDLSSDMTMIVQLIAELFFQYEKTHGGKVEEGALDYIKQSLQPKKDCFNDARNEMNAVLSLASQYITVKSLMDGQVDAQYLDVNSRLDKIITDLYAVDGEALKTATELYDRIVALKTLIQNTMGYCYDGNGNIDVTHIADLNSQGWYEQSGNVTLYLLLQQDPFEYAAGEVTLAEDQWAIGLCSDVYAYAGYSFLSASYESGLEDGTAFIKAKAAVASINGYAQFTDYLSANAEVKFAYAEGEAKAGWSDKYVGVRVEGEVGLIDAEGKIVVGSKDLNAFIKGEAKVLCADGKVAFEFEEDGQFAIGVDASATLASASVKGGTTILGYKNKDSATGETDTLLGFKVGAKADAGGSFAIWGESKTAIETDYFNVNATTVKIDAALLLGLDVSVTIPTLYPKWPWL